MRIFPCLEVSDFRATFYVRYLSDGLAYDVISSAYRLRPYSTTVTFELTCAYRVMEDTMGESNLIQVLDTSHRTSPSSSTLI